MVLAGRTDSLRDSLSEPFRTETFSRLITQETLGSHRSGNEGSTIQLSLMGKINSTKILQHVFDTIVAISGDIKFDQRFGGAHRRPLDEKAATRIEEESKSLDNNMSQQEQNENSYQRKHLFTQSKNNSEFFEHRICFHPVEKTPIGPARNDDAALWLEAEVFGPKLKNFTNANRVLSNSTNSDLYDNSTITFLKLMERDWSLVMYSSPEPVKETSGSRLLKDGTIGTLDSNQTKNKLAQGSLGGMFGYSGNKAQLQTQNEPTSQRAIHRSFIQGDAFKLIETLGYAYAFEYTRRGYRFKIDVRSHFHGTTLGATVTAAPPAPGSTPGMTNKSDSQKQNNQASTSSSKTSKQLSNPNDEFIIVEIFQIHQLQEQFKVSTGMAVNRFDISLFSMMDEQGDKGSQGLGLPDEYNDPCWFIQANYETRATEAVAHGMGELNHLADILSSLVELRAVNHNYEKAKVH